MFEAKKLRKNILTMAYTGQSVHIGCAFSLVEIFIVLYRDFFKNNHILLSKGHGVMAQYVCLAEIGLIEQSELINYFKDGSRLKGLAESEIKGIDISSGSLGHGLSVAVGIALGAKLNNDQSKTFCIVGDGESNEGSIWESIMFASHYKLNNLILIIDNNKFQAMGLTSEVMNMLNFKDKLVAFGFDTIEVDGHNENEIHNAIITLNQLNNGKPKAIVANTIKGKGVSFMENNNMWHYSRLDEKLYESSIKELSQ